MAVISVPFRRLSSFTLVGGIVFLFVQLMLYVLVDTFYWHATTANVMLLALSLWMNYWLNRKFTYNDVAFPSQGQRFVTARIGTLLLSILLFNGLVQIGWHYLVANAVGVGIGMLVNFVLTDRWVFTDRIDDYERNPDSYRLGWRTALWAAAVVAGLVGMLWYVAGGLFLTMLIVVLSVVSLAPAMLFLVSQLYTKRHDGAEADNQLRPPGGSFHERIAVIMPARKEGAVLATTIMNAAWTQRDHPSHHFFPVVCDDDPATARVAMLAASVVNGWWAEGQVVDRFALDMRMAQIMRSYRTDSSPLTEAELAEIAVWQQTDALVQVVIFPPQNQLPSKPKQLNFVFGKYAERFTAFTILDAESMAAEGLLAYVDQAFQDHPDKQIIQGGVQLMAPVFSGSRLQRLKQYFRRWYSWHNLLEYYRWFPGQLPFQAAYNFVPLGGNTVFVRTDLLVQTGGWPDTLTEDCALGVQATAVFGAKTLAFYEPHLVTREETPPTVGDFLRQRTRWGQGFLQAFLSGQWLALPTFRQKLLAFWILSSPSFQALTAPLVPLAIAAHIWLDSPPGLVLIMYLPFAAIFMSVVLLLKQLREFGAAYDRKIAWHVYVLVFISYVLVFYQTLLAIAAVRAVIRQVRGQFNWQSPARSGDVLASQPALSAVR